MIRPDDLTVVAGWVDVGRGTDLMLYCLIIAFAFTTVASYLRFRELEIRFARLARWWHCRTPMRRIGVGSGPSGRGRLLRRATAPQDQDECPRSIVLPQNRSGPHIVTPRLERPHTVTPTPKQPLIFDP